MRKINRALSLDDFKNNAIAAISDWFSSATSRFNIQKLTGYPAAGDVPKNQWGIWKNTTTGGVQLTTNDEGTLKTVSLTTTRPTAFAQHAVSQSLVTGVTTKIIYGTEILDSANCFDPVLSRFTPNVSGDYIISANLLFDYSAAPPAAVNLIAMSVTKNGVAYASTTDTTCINGTLFNVGCSGIIVNMNGSTDFIEITAIQTSGVNRPTFVGIYSSFSAHLVRPT